ncbi:MAG: hypothetical protein WB615_12195 [Candidatus Tumulicola sp.]
MTHRYLFAAAIIATAACSGNSTSPTPSAGNVAAPAVRFNAGCPKSVVYVVSNYDASVKIYDPNNLTGGPCGNVGGFNLPQGLFTDSKGNLWVADAGARQVYEFTPGTKTPVRSLSDPNGEPSDVTVDEHNNTVYVTEYKNDVAASNLVEVYANGSNVPTNTLSDPDARNGGYDAIDNQGNLYVTFMTQDNKAQVDRWTGGTGNPENLGLQLISDGGIVTTKTGALAICDPFAYRCGVFAPGSQKMAHVFGHMGRGRGDVVPNKPPWLHPDTVALDRRERRAYVASDSLTTWAFPGPERRPNHLPIDEIKVPQGGAGQGIAITPASRPGNPY